jgi:hypothetical protein
VGLKLNGTHQLLAHADNMNLLEDKIDTIKKITGALFNIRKKAVLETYVAKTKYAIYVAVLSSKYLSKY